MKEIVTESIKYTGSKKLLLPNIINTIKDYDIKTTLDGFAGTTRVGQALKQFGYNVDSNDLADYSDIFAKCYLVNNDTKKEIVEKINYLNSLKGYEGWYSLNYGGLSDENGNIISKDGKKKIWQMHNTYKLDVIRDEIEKISENELERSILLTSLLIALDKVDSTIGHQVSYLKKWSKRSYAEMKLLLPNLLIGNGEYNSIKGDILNISNEYDFVYLDPPYGTNNEKMPTSRIRYFSYYHLWTTIVRNDKPLISGAANRRTDSSDKVDGAISDFENTDYEYVKNKIETLIDNLNTKYFMFSYNNKSKVSIDDIDKLFSKYKIINKEVIEYKENVMKNMKWENVWQYDNSKNYEYLYFVKK